MLDLKVSFMSFQPDGMFWRNFNEVVLTYLHSSFPVILKVRFMNGGNKVFCVADEHSISSCIEMTSQLIYMTGGIGWAASKF